MLVLGIESSCDETAAGVALDGRQVLSNAVRIQDELHARFGGVVPEIAARRHVEVIVPVMEEALSRAGIGLEDLDGLAVTQGPGLLGALLVGLNTAKAVSLVTGLPLAGVNHLHAHVAAGFTYPDPPRFPLGAMVVSGGHTNLYRVHGPLDFELMGQTRDDAAGEAFDKVAKMTGLGYPGGKEIDRLAALGNPEWFHFPRPMKGRGLDFSFSGLKTAVLTLMEERFPDGRLSESDLKDLAASFQAAVVDVLIQKIEVFVEKTKVRQFILSGGVAGNSALRQEVANLTARKGVELILPPIHMCTDNGAMIAALGYYHLQDGRRLDPAADAFSRWPTPA